MFVIIRILNGIASSALGALELSQFWGGSPQNSWKF